MFSAICTFKSQFKKYTILEFQNLSEEELEVFRQFLKCPECDQKAFYRKRSADGKAACFGSRYHTCQDANPSTQRLNEIRHAVEVEQIIANNQEINLIFSQKELITKDDRISSIPVAEVTNTQNTTQTHTQQSDKIRTPSIELGKLLDSLICGRNLADSEIIVKIDNYSYKAKNLFVNFSDAVAASSEEDAKPKMYWGTVSHADKELQWLNPADCGDVGIILGSHKESIMQTFDIKDREVVQGAGLILFGKCYFNERKTRKIIKLWNAKRIYISLLHN